MPSRSLVTALPARRYGLTAYDAAYVELAARERLTPASLDGRTQAGAVKAGVELVLVLKA